MATSELLTRSGRLQGELRWRGEEGRRAGWLAGSKMTGGGGVERLLNLFQEKIRFNSIEKERDRLK